jgi:hypothetical protein
LRKYVYLHEQNVARNTNFKAPSNVVLDGNEEWAMGHYRIDGFVIEQQKIESCAMIGCKVELTSK